MINILVVGGGGREHALAWKLAQSEQVETVYVCPGNTGMTGSKIQVTGIDGIKDILNFAQEKKIELTVVGPEQYMVDGITDSFRAASMPIFGVSRKASNLESSKWFAKEFMLRHGIPTPTAHFFIEEDKALQYLKLVGAPIVIKADGLAAGKGVVVAKTEIEAADAVRDCFAGSFGDSGTQLLLEQTLYGPEISIMAFVDGDTITPLATAQDHKRAWDNDKGPNTGGMGAYSPVPFVSEQLLQTIEETVLKRFVAGCRADDLDYAGVIFFSLMLTEAGPQVLEFNTRFGDPETQVVLSRLKSDLVEAMQAVLERKLNKYIFQWNDDAALCVVLASRDYPSTPRTGAEITGIEEAVALGATVFHAGTRRDDNGLITAHGGRVLSVLGHGSTLGQARELAYQGVSCISWEDIFYRSDIGAQGIGA